MNHLKFYRTLIISLGLMLCGSCVNDKPLELADVFAKKKGSYPIKTRHLKDDGNPVYINRLVREDSLYLLQHAHNPVDWWSWSDEAFEAARLADKPVFLSIGYSTCHWCHVMERESFEDIQIAEYINQHFIPIKVDREENPDIDEIYITAVQKLSGSAGWPLTAVLTPDGSPFFGATYLRPEKLTDLLHRITDTWTNRREAVLEQADRVTKSLTVVNQNTSDVKKINADFIQTAQFAIANSLANRQSNQASTFPREPEMLSVLQHALHSLQKPLVDIVESRLLEIASGGIHDQIGGGFHRYSVDPEWQVPHFEKMLYNQAQMGEVYAQAYLLSGNPRLKQISLSTADFMLREMGSPDGGFYAAMDAESGGREGGYYLWDMTELSELLTPEQLDIAKQVYELSDGGNLEGSNVLQFNSDLAFKYRDELPAITKAITVARQGRTPPHTDTKIITAWNAMAISSLVAVSEVTGENRFLQAAEKAASAVWRLSFSSSDGLARTVSGSGNRKAGVLEDYAYLARAMLDLYDINGEAQWLERSEQLVDKMMSGFLDASGGAFRISAAQAQKNLIVNPTSARDDAILSGNSVAAQTLVRLFHRTGKIQYKQSAQSVIAAFSDQLLNQPQSLSGMLHAASLLNLGESNADHIVARAKVRSTTQIIGQRLELELAIEPGWHINAARVLKKELIATQLLPLESACASILNVKYPQGKEVTLGFQDEPLLVYDDTIRVVADIQNMQTGCQLVAAQLRLQACSDEICLEPETLQIRTPH